MSNKTKDYEVIRESQRPVYIRFKCRRIKHAKWVKLEAWTKFDIFAELNFNLHFMYMLFLVCNHVIRQSLVEKNNSQNFA